MNVYQTSSEKSLCNLRLDISKFLTYCYDCLQIVAILREPPLQNMFVDDDPLVKEILM
jgi:hypothetical protein